MEGRQSSSQQSSREWLKVHGLQARQLNMDQILPTLGFQQSRGEVPGLHRPVSSQYADGLFTQHPNSSGQVYNLFPGSVDRLQSVEERLLETVGQLKARLEWLNSGSRLSFGVVTGCRAVLVIDSIVPEPARLQRLLEVASSALREQFSSLEEFNVIRCTNGVECWQERLVGVSEGSIREAVQWVGATTVQTPVLTASVVEAVTTALTHNRVDGVYLLTQGESSLRAYDLLLEKVGSALVPVHVVAVDCLSSDALTKYQRLASGRCHAYNPFSSACGRQPLLSSSSSTLSPSPPSSAKRPGSAHPTHQTSSLPREEVLLVWAELEKARDTLAEVQALRLETQETTGGEAHSDHDSSEEYLTSVQWLKTHGVRARKLMFKDLVSSLAFRHCNGTIPHHMRTKGSVEMVPQSKVVHAQYCKEFVHMRQPDGTVVHVQLSERECEVYCGRVKRVVRECKERMAWLKSGSRELFGTILEDKVVLVIDTSSSMGQRLDLVKHKLLQLMQEQICQKQAFTVLQFSSGVQPWRDYLVPTSPQNLAAVGQWVQALSAGGSTNTLDVLSSATAVRGAEAVYLLTDGRPDQRPEEVLARVQEMPRIPIHTISFNCGDSKSNHFLSQLASTTGGRYYCFSEDVSDPNGPKTYQSEDIQSLEEELSLASEQLCRVQELREECRKAEWRGRGKEKGREGSGHPPPSSSRRKATLISSKKWLEKHSLASLNLTLMDALGPSAVPHSSSYVPLLDKHISSRVLPSLLPLAHVSPNGQKMTLINPTGPDLRHYHQRLEKQVECYWQRLTQLAWGAIPADQWGVVREECGVGEEETPSYQQHKTVLCRVMKELGWPRPQADFDLLEQEIAQAETYKKYSTALMEEAGRTRRTGSDSPASSGEGESVTSGESLVALMDQLQLHTASTPSPPPLLKGRGKRKESSATRGKLKGEVVARSDSDGFYYPGFVVGHTESRLAIVQFMDGQQKTVHSRHMLATGGARPIPALRPGDHVLVRVRTKQGGAHSSSNGACDYYIPAEVQLLPTDSRKGHALHSVIAFNGQTVTSARKGILKISQAQYSAICTYIRTKMAPSTHPEGTRTPSPTASSSTLESLSSRSTHTSRSASPLSPRSTHTSRSASHQSPRSTHTSRSASHQSPRSTHTSRSASHQSPRSTHTSRSASHQSPRSTHTSRSASHQSPRSTHTSHSASHQSSRSTHTSHSASHQSPRSTHTSRSASPLSPRSTHTSRSASHQSPRSTHTSRSASHQSPRSTHTSRSASPLSPRSTHTSRSASPLQTILEQQRVHGEQLEQQLSVLTSLQEQQMKLQEQLTVAEKRREVKATEVQTKDEEDEEDEEVLGKGTEETEKNEEVLEREGEEEESSVPGVTGQPPPATVCDDTLCHTARDEWIVDYLPHQPPATCDQGMNTGPWLEDRSMNTEPATESRCVGTEWSDLSSDSSSASDHGDGPSDYVDGPPLHTLPTESTPVPPPSLPADSLLGQHVLARWPDDGWYYRGDVLDVAGEQYMVGDSCGDMVALQSSDIITDHQDHQHTIHLDDTVVAPHPDYSFSYAPGLVVGVHVTASGLHYTVEFYDGTQAFLPREEVYWLPRDKHDKDVQYLRHKEKAWVGQATVARRDTDGLYYPGRVLRQLSPSRRYLIRWASGSTQEQEVVHMFGPPTWRRPLRTGDHVLALTDHKQGVCMPGEICGRKHKKLRVEFCDGKKSLVDPMQCFWISEHYYNTAVDYICSTVTPSQSGTPSEFSASYY